MTDQNHLISNRAVRQHLLKRMAERYPKHDHTQISSGVLTRINSLVLDACETIVSEQSPDGRRVL